MEMCAASTEVTDLRRALAATVERLDLGMVLPADAVRLVEEGALIERLGLAIKTLASARVAESGGWRGDGDRSPEEWLARKTGTTTGDAAATVSTGQLLRDLPATTGAVQRGELSGPQVREIAGAAAIDPAAEHRLLEQAAAGSLGELREACKRTRAAADPDPDATQRRIHARRSLRSWVDAEGVGHAHLTGTPSAIGRIMAAVQHRAEKVFAEARTAGRRERAEAYQFDALEDLVTAEGAGAPLPKGANAKIIVRIDHAALLRGKVIEGESCEIAGIGPVPVSLVREWMQDAFLAAIVTKGVDICSVVHLGRRPKALQTTALQWRDPQCAVAGCTRTLRLEADHRTGWAVTHRTEVDDVDHLCNPHHAQKTRHGWMLEAGTGKRRFLPPHHPDHPLQVELAKLMRRKLGRKDDPPLAG